MIIRNNVRRVKNVCGSLRLLSQKTSVDVHGPLSADDVQSKTMRKKLRGMTNNPIRDSSLTSTLQTNNTGSPQLYQPQQPQDTQRPSFFQTALLGAGLTVGFISVAGLLRMIGL